MEDVYMAKKKDPIIIISKKKMDSLKLSFSDFPMGKGNYQNRTFMDNIPGYPGYYISKRGKIYSRWSIHGEGKLMKRYHIKKPSIREGRYYIKLSQPYNKPISWAVSRLVALVYVPNPDNKPYVCHKDNNPMNNYYQNLYWGTQKDNMEQASNDGRMVNKYKGIPKKGTCIQRSYIPILKERGFTFRQISEILNLSMCRIKEIYNLYRNNTFGTSYFIRKRKDK